jgi:hypothetical protein
MRRAPLLFLCVVIGHSLAFSIGCSRDVSTPRHQEASIRTWRFADGSEFAAWTITSAGPDPLTYMWVSLDKGEAWYRVGQNGAWRPMELRLWDQDLRQLQFGATERLPPGTHSISFRMAPPGGPLAEYCCLRTTVEQASAAPEGGAARAPSYAVARSR